MRCFTYFREGSQRGDRSIDVLPREFHLLETFFDCSTEKATKRNKPEAVLEKT
jgi:hypothetical protein